jgi:outer membrane protein assembly factor BamB
MFKSTLVKRAARLALLSAAALLAGPCGLAQRETQFRGDAAHSGAYATDAPESISHVLWRFQTGGRIFASPVVAEGIVYVGSNDHFLHAIDGRKGVELWKFKTGGNVTSTAAVARGIVYVLSLDGNAYALNAQTGSLKWKFETLGEARLSAAGLYGLAPAREIISDPWDFFLSSPTVSGGSVYFGSGDHNVYALDAQTGKLQWKYHAGDVVHSSPAIANGILYIGCWDGVLYALNARTGQLAWKFATGTDPTHFMQGIPGSAAVSDGVVVFGNRDNYIYALDANTGGLLWRESNQNSWIISSPAISNGVVYVTTSDTMKLRALDMRTGQPLFELSYQAYSFSSPAIAAGHAYFGTFDGYLHDVNLASRRFQSEYRVQASAENRELLTEDGHLNAPAIFGPLGPDGQPDNTSDAAVVGVDRLLHLGSILASPCVADGVVYAASADGFVYALD